MSGKLQLGRDAWLTSSWTFYWTVDQLAEIATHTGLIDRLQVIEDDHLGALDADELDGDERCELLRAIGELPMCAARVMPDSPVRDAVLAQLQELARMAGTAPR